MKNWMKKRRNPNTMKGSSGELLGRACLCGGLMEDPLNEKNTKHGSTGVQGAVLMVPLKKRQRRMKSGSLSHLPVSLALLMNVSCFVW